MNIVYRGTCTLLLAALLASSSFPGLVLVLASDELEQQREQNGHPAPASSPAIGPSLQLRHDQQYIDRRLEGDGRGLVQRLADILFHGMPHHSSHRSLRALDTSTVTTTDGSHSLQPDPKVKVCHWTEGQPKAGGGGKWVVIEIKQSALGAHFSQHVDSGKYQDCRCHEDGATGCKCNEFGCTGICFNVDCSALTDGCNVGICNSETGGCEQQPANEGLSCDDGDLCTQTDTCRSGVCVGSDVVDCSDKDDACNVGICNSETGGCEQQPTNEGLGCDDKELCSWGDICQSGTCVGTKVDCSALTDQCNIGICDSGTGACAKEPVEDGRSCNDGDLCSREDTCQSGVCLGVDLVESIEHCIGGSLATKTYVDTEVGGLRDTVQSWIAQNVATETYVDEKAQSLYDAIGSLGDRLEVGVGSLELLSRDSHTSYGSVAEAILDITSSLQKQISELQTELAALRCGNGELDPGEECDDGNNNGGDGCSETCFIETSEPQPVCGDGTIDAGEECDDGNNDDGDGCSATCTIESASACLEPLDLCEVNNLEGVCDPDGHCITSHSCKLGLDLFGDNNNDQLGYSHSGSALALSADGKRVAIGAYQHDVNALDADIRGHVRVFQLVQDDCDSVWEQVGSDIDGEGDGDRSGHSIAMSASGDRVVIGGYYSYDEEIPTSSGHVRVYDLVEGSWTKTVDFPDVVLADSNFVWYSVAMAADGLTIVIGAYNHLGTAIGIVRVYKNMNEGSWAKLGQDIPSEEEGGEWGLGYSVAISADGSIIAIGAPHYNADSPPSTSSGDLGLARIFQLDTDSSGNPTWNQLGSDIVGERVKDFSGASISLSADGKRIAIGAQLNDGGVNNGMFQSGHVRVYALDETANPFTWEQLGSDIDGEAPEDQSGCSVAITGDGAKIVIGAKYNDDKRAINYGDGRDKYRGHVRVYEWDKVRHDWAKTFDDIDGEEKGDQFGFSATISSDGTMIAVAAPYYGDNTISPPNDRGHVQIFELRGGESCPCEAEGD